MCIILLRQKISKATQNVISHANQYSLPVGRLSKDAGNGHGPGHGTKNDIEISLPLRCCRSRHEINPPMRMLFHQAGNSFPNSDFGASNLRCQRRNRATGVRMITVLRRKVPPNHLLPPVLSRHVLQGGKDVIAKLRESLRNGIGEKVVLAPEMLVKTAHRQTRRLHYAGNARTAQPLCAKLPSGVPHNTIPGSRLVFRFVTHITSDWITYVISGLTIFRLTRQIAIVPD